MAQPGSGAGRRRRAGRFGTGKLIVISAVVAALCMVGLSAAAVTSRASCTNSPVLVNLAVSNDIAPAVEAVANAYNKQNATVAGRCVQVQVTQTDSAAEAAVIDGQAKPQAVPADAWIPDSTLWLDVARSYPVGAQTVQPTGKSVARSPLVLVTTAAVAAATHVFDVPPGWNLLLPPAYGGPPANLGLSVMLPDPADSAAGLASLVEVSRALGTGATARTAVTDFAFGVQSTPSFNSAAALSQFVQTTQYPLERKSLTVATEQAVLTYDKANPKAPLDARYASSPNQALGTPEFDYPYVLTTAKSVPLQAAKAFGNYLQTGYAQSVMRYYGFRSADGLPAVMPQAAGLAAQPLQLATTVSPTEAAANLQVWDRLGLGYRELVLTDVSPAMRAPSGLGTLTVQQLVSETAAKGLGLFPDSTQMGLWEIGKSPSARPPYTQLVSIGPLSASYGLISRRAQIEQIDATTTTSPSGALALNDALLAAYRAMTKTYAPGYSNAIIVLTAGINSARADMSTSALVSQLQRLYNPAKKVEIVILMFGSKGNFQAMQAIANATGGIAFQVTNPSQIAQDFIEAVSQRMCNQGCVAP